MFLGNLTEKILGWKAILTLYFGGAAAAALALVLVAGHVDTPFAGSFNAISAIIGAYLILYPVGVIKTWGSFSPQASRIMQLLILWLFINVATNISVTSDVSGIFGNMLISVAPTMASFAFGLFAARPLLLWKYRNA
jgi:membrane associated rhomboid family serine protease